VNRYVLSGDLLAGRITKITKADSSTQTKTSYYNLDHLNSTKCITNETGTVEVMYEYRAFGDQLKRLDAEGADTTDKAKYSFGGKELDNETNLYYFNARYYDATIGRFINADPIQDGTNWYVYCRNNPLSMKDPTGLEGICSGQGKINTEGQKLYMNLLKAIKGTTYDAIDLGTQDGDGNEQYRTYCNVFAYDFCTNSNADKRNYNAIDQYNDDLRPILNNNLAGRTSPNSAYDNALQNVDKVAIIKDPAAAQARADLGKRILVIRNGDQHIGIVSPDLGHDYDPEKGPLLCQQGIKKGFMYTNDVWSFAGNWKKENLVFVEVGSPANTESQSTQGAPGNYCPYPIAKPINNSN
jgi:RHS repeat-associated protein